SFDKCGHSNTTGCNSMTYAARHPTLFFVSPSACHFGKYITPGRCSTTVRSKQPEIIIMSAWTRTIMPQLLSAQEERENVPLKNRTHAHTLRRSPLRRHPVTGTTDSFAGWRGHQRRNPNAEDTLRRLPVEKTGEQRQRPALASH